MNVQQGPKITDKQRLKNMPSILTGYAKDIEKHGAPIDSGLPEILRFVAKKLSEHRELLTNIIEKCTFAGNPNKSLTEIRQWCERGESV